MNINYPCKDCLIVTTCKQQCPNVSKYMNDSWSFYDDDNLTCTYCGSMLINRRLIWECSNCMAKQKFSWSLCHE